MVGTTSEMFGLAFLCLSVSAATGQMPPADPLGPARVPALEDTGPLAALGAPRADWAFAPPPGWFLDLQAAAAWTLIDLGVYGPEPPTLNKLDWTVLPKADLGYRFDSGDAVLLDYRYLGDVANAKTLLGEPFTEDHETFLSHELTLDYQSRVYQPLCGTALQWQAGVRIAAFNFTTLDHWDGVEADQWGQKEVAAGPHVGIKPAVQCGASGLTAFAVIDGSELVGLKTQTVQTTSVTGDGSGPPTTSGWRNYSLAAALEVGWEVGLSYTFSSLPSVRLAAGYQGECLFWVGRSFTEQGPFIRLGAGF